MSGSAVPDTAGGPLDTTGTASNIPTSAALDSAASHHTLGINLHSLQSGQNACWSHDLVAAIDGREVVVTESLIRAQLQLDDANGIFDMQIDDIFAGMGAIGYPPALRLEVGINFRVPLPQPLFVYRLGTTFHTTHCLAIAAAGNDAADEENVPAHAVAGSPAEAHPVPHPPPFSPVREPTPERLPETEWVVPIPVSPITDWRPWLLFLHFSHWDPTLSLPDAAPAEFLAEDAQARQRLEEEQASARLVQQLQAEDLAQADVPLVSEQRAKELDELLLRMTDTDWLTLMMQVGTNPALARELLGADVNEDNFIERMTAIKERKKRALAELRYRALKVPVDDFLSSESESDDDIEDCVPPIPYGAFKDWEIVRCPLRNTYYHVYYQDNRRHKNFFYLKELLPHVYLDVILDSAGGGSTPLSGLLFPDTAGAPIWVVCSTPTCLPYVIGASCFLVVCLAHLFVVVFASLDLCACAGLLPHVYHEDLLLLRRRMNRYFRLNPDVDVGLDLWRDVNLLCQSLHSDDVEDFWRTQDEWVVSGWRLYPKSSVHVLDLTNGKTVYMFVDKFYPIRAPLLERMLRHRLTVPPSYCRDVVVAGSVIQTIQDGLRESYECLASAPIDGLPKQYRYSNSPPDSRSREIWDWLYVTNPGAKTGSCCSLMMLLSFDSVCSYEFMAVSFDDGCIQFLLLILLLLVNLYLACVSELASSRSVPADYVPVSVISSSTVTYTSVYIDSEPWRFQWVFYEEPEAPTEAPTSPDYMSGPEHPPFLDYVHGLEEPEQAPLSPDYV
ncbi:hypothetical protein Tco_0843989, partial [Tanacetum coccineum]